MLRWVAPLSICLGLGLGSPSGAAPPSAGKQGGGKAGDDKKAPVPAVAVHKVKRGETVWGIARFHGVSVGDLMDLNRLDDPALREGQLLKIPTVDREPAPPPIQPVTHTVARGESFSSIARKHGISQDDLKRANPSIDPGKLQAGAKLKIPAAGPASRVAAGAPPNVESSNPATPKTDTGSDSIYIVESGDTFSSIAMRHGVGVAAIAAANPGVVPEKIRPGMKLVLPGCGPEVRGAGAERSQAAKAVASEAPSAIGADPAVATPKSATRRYIVSADETPQTISEAFGITLARLYEINGLKPGSAMRPGMEIQVPQTAGGDR